MNVSHFPRASAALRRILVLNSKGGCGKSTLATNLAGYYARTGRGTVLMDYDPQGAATYWLGLRGPQYAPIHGIAARRPASGVTRAWQLRIPPGSERVVVDSPAGVTGFELAELVRNADDILIPVLPSHTDIHAVSRFIAELLLEARVRTTGARVGLVANRVRANTRVFHALERFLARLQLPVVAVLRDSQNYIRAGQGGTGIHELRRGYRVRKDLAQWQPLIEWLESGAQPARDTGHAPAAQATHLPRTSLS